MMCPRSFFDSSGCPLDISVDVLDLCTALSSLPGQQQISIDASGSSSRYLSSTSAQLREPFSSSQPANQQTSQPGQQQISIDAVHLCTNRGRRFLHNSGSPSTSSQPCGQHLSETWLSRMPMRPMTSQSSSCGWLGHVSLLPTLLSRPPSTTLSFQPSRSWRKPCSSLHSNLLMVC